MPRSNRDMLRGTTTPRRCLISLRQQLSGTLRAVCLASCIAGVATTPTAGADLETRTARQVGRTGLVGVWERHTSIPGGYDAITSVEIVVDAERKRSYAELKSGDTVYARIAADTLNSFGQPIGIEEAQRLCKLENYKLKRRGIEAEVSVIEVPEIRIYTLGRDGTLEARDAETGQLMWAERFGDSRIPSLPLAVNEKYAAVVNGLELFIVDALTGKEIRRHRFDAVPLQGVTLIGDFVMAVCTRGRVQGFSITREDREPFTGRVAGLPLADPVAAPNFPRLMWPTDQGFLYALDGEGSPGFVFRFPTEGMVSSPLAAGAGGRFYAGTDKGHIYSIDSHLSGKVLWRRSIGAPVYASPTLLENRLFITTVYGQLFCLDAATGNMLWQRPVGNVEKVLGGSENQILVRTVSARLSAIDAESGSIIAEFDAPRIVDAVRNPLTDRTYLLTSDGSIQCLRPKSTELPRLLDMDLSTDTSGTASEENTSPQPNSGQSPFGNEAPDPFGGAGNPFGGDGGGNQQPDPFGGSGADPFGGGNGGAADPFGNF